MPLIDLKTNLKDLKFGHDEYKGGSSNEPYIQTRIPATNEPLQTAISISGDNLTQTLGSTALSIGAGAAIGAIGGGIAGNVGAGAIIGAVTGLGVGIAGNSLTGNSISLKSPTAGTGGPDFLIRGGSLLPNYIINDTIRLSKFFADTKGILFTLKQNVLSRTGTRAQGSTGLLNEKVYTPISALLGAVGSPFGLHVNKQGLNPFQGIGQDYVPDRYYENMIDQINEINQNPNSDAITHNRLYGLYSVKILGDALIPFYRKNYITDKNSPDLLAYPGGPGSILGIGKTHIKILSDQRTGVENVLLKTNPLRFYGWDKKITTEYLTRAGEFKSIPTTTEEKFQRFLGASSYYEIDNITNSSLENLITPGVTSSILDLNNNNTEVYSPGDIRGIETEPGLIYQGTGIPFLNGKSILYGTRAGDFRAALRNQTAAPNYANQNIETRTKIGDPGNAQNKKLTSYTQGYNNLGAASEGSYDKINASSVGQYSDNTDLINFKLSVFTYANNVVSQSVFQFRAFLDQISDTYNSIWEPTKFIGRGENFYNYSGFDRKISLSWTVAAQSKIELNPMYERLNYLASIITPDYGTTGLMRGNITTLTIGNYIKNQPGIITGLSYEMNNENESWEIGINDVGNRDTNIKQLPHIIRVKGFSFIPIHKFVPRLGERFISQ